MAEKSDTTTIVIKVPKNFWRTAAAVAVGVFLAHSSLGAAMMTTFDVASRANAEDKGFCEYALTSPYHSHLPAALACAKVSYWMGNDEPMTKLITRVASDSYLLYSDLD
jgi:hypothetical protein